MNNADMEKLAAKESVSETFLTLGMDISNPISVQNQFAFLRNLHYSMRHVRNIIIAGVLGALMSGGVYAFWLQGQCRGADVHQFRAGRLPVI
jgi:hypothetical protein